MKLIAAVLLITGLAGAQAYIDPDTGAMRVYDVPVGAEAGLTWVTDTLHVTTAEKGWLLSATADGAIDVVVINPDEYYLLVRFDTSGSPLQTYIGASGSREFLCPGMQETVFDSIFIDGEGACTVYIDYWHFE